MKVVVGLGNPGPQYRNTRHNLGFEAADLLAERLGTRFDREKHQGLLAETSHAGHKVLLVKPMTFMNLSGNCVAPLTRNKIDSLEDVIVLTDDINLPLGRLRIRASGSAGGHNGLKSLIERLGGHEFPRVRMGVGENSGARPLSDHVLSRFRPEEREAAAEMIDRAADAALRWIEAGIERAMSEFNQRAPGGAEGKA